MSGLALVILSVITSTLSHPYGPAASQHSGSTSSSGGGGYVASGNDQLRFHPEESQFYSNQPTQPQQTAPVNNAPSYADLVNLAQQEAQQQAIIDAQKKMETNKLVKDIEFIQKQQEILQQQVHAQEVKNEQKLNNPGSYAGSTGSSAQSSSGSYGSNSGSAYNPQQSNSPATFSSGQWVPDNNAQKYNDGLYKGEGSHTKPSSSAGGSYSGADSFSGASSQQSVTQKHHQTGHSGPSNSGSYGGFPSPNQPQNGGGFPEFQSPPATYPSPNPTSSYGGSSPSGSYGEGPSPVPTSSYGGSSPQFSQNPPQFPVSSPQQPNPTNPSYGSSQSQYQSQQEYWWNGPNSPFSQNQLSNCNYLDCNPAPSINKPPPPKPGYGPPPPPPPPAQNPPTSVEPVNINQNPYLSGAINNKPPGQSSSGPSYGSSPPPPSYGPAPPPPPPAFGPAPPPPSYAPPPPPPSYAPPPPPPNTPQTFPQKPFPTKPSPTYQPSKPTPAYNPPSTFPSPQLTNPDAPAGGYGSSGGGTPGISYPDYQPDDVERVPCTQLGHTCVAKHLCVNGKVNSNGIGLIQLRFSMKSCRADIEACCKEDAGVEGSYSPPPSSYQPKPSSGPVDSYGQPTSSYALPPGESCSACAGGDGGSYSHQNSQETSFHHKQQSSSSYNSGSANLPSAKLPDFGPPSVGGAGYGK
uniref:PPAF-2-like Clip domain-containing protein n=1 Tax=Cacopsylla melanoneura TaxID=428564 RepID=A0A8D8WIS8_9HEMI